MWLDQVPLPGEDFSSNWDKSAYLLYSARQETTSDNHHQFVIFCSSGSTFALAWSISPAGLHAPRLTPFLSFPGVALIDASWL